MTTTTWDSDSLRVGEEVFAIGNAFGLEQTLTRGIVSAVNRIVPGSTWSVREPMIQTDAAINHGSSGGPLVDRCGRVVGINTAILPDAQGIGFSIPIDVVRGKAITESNTPPTTSAATTSTITIPIIHFQTFFM